MKPGEHQITIGTIFYKLTENSHAMSFQFVIFSKCCDFECIQETTRTYLKYEDLVIQLILVESCGSVIRIVYIWWNFTMKIPFSLPLELPF